MADRGIEVVHAHLASLPSGLADHRRAPRPVRARGEGLSRSTRGQGRARRRPARRPRMAAPSVRERARRALPARRWLRHRLAALHRHLAPPRGRGGRQRAPARLPPGARASFPGGGRRRASPPIAGFSTRASRPSTSWSRATRRAADSRWPRCWRSGRRACRCRRPACASRRGSISPAAAGAINRRPMSIRSCAQAGVAEMARAYLGTTVRDRPRLAALRRSPRPAAAPDPRRERRGAARRRHRARRAGEGGRRRRDARGCDRMIHVWHWFLRCSTRRRPRSSPSAASSSPHRRRSACERAGPRPPRTRGGGAGGGEGRGGSICGGRRGRE